MGYVKKQYISMRFTLYLYLLGVTVRTLQFDTQCRPIDLLRQWWLYRHRSPLNLIFVIY